MITIRGQRPSRHVRNGDLGKIRYIYSNRLNLGKLRTEESVLWSFAPHDISAILGLLGDELPVDVAAHGGSYLNTHIADVTLSSLTFASDVRAHIFVSWLHPFKEQRLVVVGDQKMAEFADTDPTDKLKVFEHQGTGKTTHRSPSRVRRVQCHSHPTNRYA